MNEAAEEEDTASVYAQLTPVAHNLDDQMDEVNMDAEEQAEDGSSEGFMEVNRLTPPREAMDDELPCANCDNYRNNTLKAFEAASDMSKLQAAHHDLNMKYQNLCKNNASAAGLVEESYKKLRDTEVQRDSLQGDLSLSLAEVQRLQEQNKQYLEAARLTDKHRQAADDWRNKYVQSQALLLEKSNKYGEIEDKYKNAVDLVKSTLGTSSDNVKKARNLQEKLDKKNNENRAIKKHWNVVARLISDISRQCSDLPISIRERLDKLPIDELLQIAKPNSGAADNSDDEDAEAIQRLLNADSEVLHSVVISSPRKSKGGTKGRGGRAGRGRVHSTIGGGEKSVVDESMHEDMLARKLNRKDAEMTPSVSSDPAAKSVMGKKTETVREQQERQKGGIKDIIAGLKKVEHSKESDAKKVVRELINDEAPVGGSPFAEDFLMSDDDDMSSVIEKQSNNADAPTTSFEYDDEMPDFGGEERFEGEISLEKEKQSGGETAQAAVNASAVKTVAHIDETSAPVSSSPTKIIQHPKVVELSKGVADSEIHPVVSKRDLKFHENIAALGMNMSDSDESDNENEDDKDMRNEDMDNTAKALPESIKNPPSSSKSPKKLPTHHSQKSPLAVETPKPHFERKIVKLPTPSVTNTPSGISTRINKADPVHKPSMGPPTSVISATVPSTSHSISSSLSSGHNLLDEILEGAHKTSTEKMQDKGNVLSPMATPIEKAKEKTEETKEVWYNAADFMRTPRRRSGCLNGKTAETDSEQELEARPVYRRTRSKDIVGDDTEEIKSKRKTSVPMVSTKSIPSIPSKPVPIIHPKSTTRTPSITTPKDPSKTISKPQLKTAESKTPKTPSKRGATQEQQKRVNFPKSGLSDDSSDDDNEDNEVGEELASEDPMPRGQPVTRAAAAEAHSSIRPSRSISIPAGAAVNRRPSTSTKVEAVPRKERPGTQQAGAAKEAAARLRKEAVVEAAAPNTAKHSRLAKVSATSTHHASEDDATPFSRNSRRTAVAAPRRPTVATTEDTSVSATAMEKESSQKLPLSPLPPASDELLTTKKDEVEDEKEEALNEVIEDAESVAAVPVETTADPAHEAAEEKDEIEPGSCIVEDEGEADERNETRVEIASLEEPSTSAIESDSDMGDLIIDSGPNSPVVAHTVRSPIIPPTEESVQIEPMESSDSGANMNDTQTPPASSSSTSSVKVEMQQPKLSAAVRPPPVSANADAVPSNASTIASTSTAASLDQELTEKRKAVIARMSSVASSSARGGIGSRGSNVGRGGKQIGGSNAVRPNTVMAGGSRTSAMESQMARMSKNLHSGKPALSGTLRQRQRQPHCQPTLAVKVAPPVANTKQDSQLPSMGVVRKEVVAPGRVGAQPKTRLISEPRPLKRKAPAMHAVEAVAVRAPDPRTKALPVSGSLTASAADASSVNSQLITMVLEVCRDDQTVERAMQHMHTLITTMRMQTIVQCFCKALMELPQSNTWHVVRANMSMNVENLDRNRVVPKAERNLFELLLAMQDRDQVRLAGLFDCFYDEYCRHVLSSISTSHTTADVTRIVRCLFFALIVSNRDEGERVEDARKLFLHIIQNKSSQAVCQSLVYLLCHGQTAPLASEILKTELDDDEFGGRLMSMHMNNKDVEVLKWAVDRFANDSCKEHHTAAFRTPATPEMVQEWWASDMEFLEKARDRQESVHFGPSGRLEIDTFNKEHIMRMAVLISPQFRIEGLDRVKLLMQLDHPVIDLIYRVTPIGSTESVRSRQLFGDTSTANARVYLDASEARVVCLKLYTGLAALTSFYTDRMYSAEQREALRLHLAYSVEKVHSIISRPLCSVMFTPSSPLSKEDGLHLAITAIKKWIEVVQGLTKKDLMDTTTTTSAEPAKKRSKGDEYSNDP